MELNKMQKTVKLNNKLNLIITLQKNIICKLFLSIKILANDCCLYEIRKISIGISRIQNSPILILITVVKVAKV